MATRARRSPTKRKPTRRRRAPLNPQPSRLASEMVGAVTLRTSTLEIVLPREGSKVTDLAEAAMQWTYVVRSRQRWSAATSSTKRQAAAAEDFLSTLGIDSTLLNGIAQAEVVEVSTNWSGNEEDGWPARILPWEYVIAGATHTLRDGQPLTVIRHLNDASKPSPVRKPVSSVLFVASEPGPLQGRYDFKLERELVKSGFRARSWRELSSPTADQLQNAISVFKPDVIHLAGFDTHFARTILLQSEDYEGAAHLEEALAKGKGADEIGDGYVLAGPSGLDPVRPERLGKILTANNHRPQLIALNIGNSAARIAPLIVAQGALAAIGFQDNFNDELAELFFSILYARLNDQTAQLTEAFEAAWQRVRTEPSHRQGTGVVLWSITSAFLDRLGHRIGSSDRQQKDRAKRMKGAPEKPIQANVVGAGEGDKWITVDIEPCEDLNYSMLHNQRPLFKKFVIHSRQSRLIVGLRARVSLLTGTDSAVFDRTLNITPPSFDLNPHIHVPLTSSITRSVHESVRTSLFVEVLWGEHVLYRDSKRVRLTPVDQWRDSDIDRKWLPSFIFPRDAAVMKLVDTAQRYVRVLRDDPSAGFDGYQSFDPKRPDSASEIDLQVQAIWSAIVHELRLGYINPPPGYSNELDCQRLRTPSMIARDHSGTCIDLALFFAACLELVDIYPVIFLLDGHAFPGYWRSSDFHDQFTQARPEDIQDIVRADSQTTGIYGAQIEPWYLGKPTYREIVQLVNTGKLVPIETVRLTENSGFFEAIDAGRDNLRIPREFEAMVDIALAREKQITPLPILGEQL
jgi:hypothetical protein